MRAGTQTWQEPSAKNEDLESHSRDYRVSYGAEAWAVSLTNLPFLRPVMALTMPCYPLTQSGPQSVKHIKTEQMGS